uniref:Uncharacterized protein n=1 Tax=Sphaerodactylus townsendi TaxID=933632 RepID=A0ACB8F6X7_9SAUR
MISLLLHRKEGMLESQQLDAIVTWCWKKTGQRSSNRGVRASSSEFNAEYGKAGLNMTLEDIAKDKKFNILFTWGRDSFPPSKSWVSEVAD